MSAQEDLEKFIDIAKDLGLNQEEGTKFVDEAMQRKGHKRQSSWVDAVEEAADHVSSLFGGNRRETRNVGNNRDNNNSDWQYGS